MTMSTTTKPAAAAIIAMVVIGGALGAGYWFGQRGDDDKKAAPAASAKPAEKKLLYYRNPMGLADTSPTPKQDAMGMDYIPVYEGGDTPVASNGQVMISTEKLQKLGVRTEVAALHELSRVVRAVGRVEVDERRMHTIAPKFEGWIEELFVNTTGQAVNKGDKLALVYSPELISAQSEYAIAARGQKAMKDASPEAQQSMRQLADSSLMRLRNWGVSSDDVAKLRESGQIRRMLVPVLSPVWGVVMEKKAIAGMRFMPGDVLYQIADLSQVWIVADIYEQDLALVKLGQTAKIKVAAYPDQVFDAKVTYVYPTVNAQTRTVPIRLELANKGGLLKPAMFADVELAALAATKRLTVPTSAVIDSGTRRVVLVEVAEGRFEPRDVKLGRRGDSEVEVLEGVGEGEKVVVGANFLIDAESNLRAALSGMGGTGSTASPKPETQNQKPEAGTPQSETRNPKPETHNQHEGH